MLADMTTDQRQLTRSAASHRRLARFARSRLRRVLRAGVACDCHGTPKDVLIRSIDANLRCSAADFARVVELRVMAQVAA
jgi:hypothetical protein